MAKGNYMSYEDKHRQNQDLVDFTLAVRELGEFKISNKCDDALDLVKCRTNEYWRLCRDYGQIPTLEGMASALGISRMTFISWRDGNTQWTKDNGIMEYLQSESAGLATAMVGGMNNGSIMPVAGVAQMNNNHGFTTEHKTTHEHRLEVSADVKELLEEAKNMDHQARLGTRPD